MGGGVRALFRGPEDIGAAVGSRDRERHPGGGVPAHGSGGAHLPEGEIRQRGAGLSRHALSGDDEEPAGHLESGQVLRGGLLSAQRTDSGTDAVLRGLRGGEDGHFPVLHLPGGEAGGGRGLPGPVRLRLFREGEAHGEGRLPGD